MNDEGGSRVVLVVYAVMLGWFLNSWWKAEKERIVWDSADELFRRQAAEKRFNLQDPQPAEASAST